MENLIRALEVSEQSISLGLRRRPLPPPQPRTEPVERQTPAQATGLRQSEPPSYTDTRAPKGNGEEKPDAARLEAEREKIRSELSREFDARAQSALEEAKTRG